MKYLYAITLLYVIFTIALGVSLYKHDLVLAKRLEMEACSEMLNRL